MQAVIGVLEDHTSFVPQPAQGAPRYRCDFLFSFSGGVPCYHCVIFFLGGAPRYHCHVPRYALWPTLTQ